MITLVHHSITYRQMHVDLFPGDDVAEHLTISVEVHGAQLLISNIYIPPAASCPPTYQPNFQTLFNTTEDVLIMGDFNAHDDLWFSSTLDDRAATRGANINSALETSQLMVINQDSPTRVPSSGDPSSPDITITNSHLGIDSSWETRTTLNSDHLPIIVDLDGWFREPPRYGPPCYINFRKADWESFTGETEDDFGRLPAPTSCATGEKIFRRTLGKVSKRNIPRGRVPDFTPGLTPHCK